MAKQSGFKINEKGFRQLRNSPEARRAVNDIAKRIQAEASRGGTVEGYKFTELVLEDNRAAASVMATGHARNDNRKRHALVTALIHAKK